MFGVQSLLVLVYWCYWCVSVCTGVTGVSVNWYTCQCVPCEQVCLPVWTVWTGVLVSVYYVNRCTCQCVVCELVYLSVCTGVTGVSVNWYTAGRALDPWLPNIKYEHFTLVAHNASKHFRKHLSSDSRLLYIGHLHEFQWIFKKMLIYCVCERTCAHVRLYMWSVNSLCGSVLSFHHVGSRDRTQVCWAKFSVLMEMWWLPHRIQRLLGLTAPHCEYQFSISADSNVVECLIPNVPIWIANLSFISLKKNH